MKYSSGVRVLVLVALAGGTFAIAQGGAGSKGDADSSVNVNDSQVVNESQLAADQAAVNANGAMQPGDSHVRIVRLSDVSGTVGMDRLTGQGIETAIRNMPIVEGAKLGTGPNGLAEVEFEDQSTIGLAPKSFVEFSQLVRHGAGGTASTVKLVRGTMYVNLQGTKGNGFVVQVAGQNVTVAPGTRLRLQTPDVEKGEEQAAVATSATLAVFSGSAVVQGSAGGEVTVGKKESLALGGDAGTAQVAKNIEKNPYDAWNKEEDEYQQRYSKANSLVGSGYGISDLNYYGTFASLPGCGMMWQPYFVDASWNPYATGLWASYPGAGYSWVSPYPWGWLPYHSGQWMQCGGAGWGWRPGGAFYGLNNVAYGGGGGGGVGVGGVPVGVVGGRPVNGTPVNGKPPIHFPLPKPPAAGSGSLVMATKGPIVSSRMENEGFTFQRNSAGLGVPRGQLGNLHGISNDVVHHGDMTMPVDVHSAMRGANPNGEVRGPVMMKPAGAPEVREAIHNGAGPGGNRGNEAGNRPSGSGSNNSGSAPQHNSGGSNSGGAAQHTYSGGGGGNYGGGGGGNRGGGGSAPAPSSSPAPASSGGGGAATGGGSHK